MRRGEGCGVEGEGCGELSSQEADRELNMKLLWMIIKVKMLI